METWEHLEREVIPSLWIRRRFLLSITLIGLLVSSLVALLVPRKYEAVARLMTTGQRNSSALYVGLLQSRTVQDQLVDRFDLRKEYWDRTGEDARKDLEKHSQIKDDDEHGVISVAVWDKNPVRAAAMVQDYLDQMNLLLIRLDTTSAHRERVFLEGTLQSTRKDLDSAQAQLSKFLSRNEFVDMEPQENGMLNVPGRTQGTVVVPTTPEENTEYPDFGAQDPPPEPGIGGLVDLEFRAANVVQEELRAEQVNLTSLRGIYGDASVEVRMTQAKIGNLERELAKLKGQAGQASPVRKGPHSLYPPIMELPSLGARYVDLRRDVELDDALVGELDDAFEIAKIAEASDIQRVDVLDPPEVPEKAAWPPRAWIILLSTACSFGLGVAWAPITMMCRGWS